MFAKRAVYFYRRWTQFIPQLIIPVRSRDISKKRKKEYKKWKLSSINIQIFYLAMMVWLTTAVPTAKEMNPLVVDLKPYSTDDRPVSTDLYIQKWYMILTGCNLGRTTSTRRFSDRQSRSRNGPDTNDHWNCKSKWGSFQYHPYRKRFVIVQIIQSVNSARSSWIRSTVSRGIHFSTNRDRETARRPLRQLRVRVVNEYRESLYNFL